MRCIGSDIQMSVYYEAFFCRSGAMCFRSETQSSSQRQICHNFPILYPLPMITPGKDRALEVGVFWVSSALLPAHREVARWATELPSYWPGVKRGAY